MTAAIIAAAALGLLVGGLALWAAPALSSAISQNERRYEPCHDCEFSPTCGEAFADCPNGARL